MKRLAPQATRVIASARVNRRLWPNCVVWAALPCTALWLVLGLLLLPAILTAAEGTYTVKKGDTVVSIARRFGIPASTLAERNGLSRTYHLYAGQRLFIPLKPARTSPPAAKSAAPQKRASVVLPSAIQQAIDKTPVTPGRWKYIVIHHSGVDTGTVQAMDKYHREVRHMENGLAYHFVIGNGSGMGDGEITATRRWMRQLDGGHLASESQNKIALGICLVGNFDERPPTSKELASLRAVVQALMARCKLTPQAVKTHQQINVVHTRCPGTRFPTKAFMDSLRGPSR